MRRPCLGASFAIGRPTLIFDVTAMRLFGHMDCIMECPVANATDPESNARERDLQRSIKNWND
jgi:hypothetical protein